MTYVELMKTLRICSVGNSTDCDVCPLHSSHDCHTIMARNALAELERQEKALIMQEKKMSEIAKKYDPIEIVMTALNKGGYSVTVDPTGEVRLMPWGETARLIKDDTQSGIWRCSACGKKYGWVSKTFKFCPNCGAEMEDDNEDD